MNAFLRNGFHVFERDARVLKWASAAADVARKVAQDPAMRAQWLRHQETWFVGVDALPNATDGAIANVPLAGPWEAQITPPRAWHKAQLSVVYEGYPLQDAGESDANHRFRIKRYAAHVDGILLEQGRRFLREPHAFVLGLPLGDSCASPLVVWPSSHVMMRASLRRAIGAAEPASIDLTDAYKAARAEVFAQIEPVEINARMGQSMLLHRHLLHGVAPWKAADTAPPEGRMVAYFRPQFEQVSDWLTQP
ncbi:hypothetical protein [Planktotalea arctica]|uniref:hypothetical protein n=1 Tax=Planktotalea arctica TaxID=1481893 RepID=UPI000A175A96|nr:hypothetical protein [Planktotalea arctica]